MPEEAFGLPRVSESTDYLSRRGYPNGICNEISAIFQNKQRERKRSLWNTLQRYEKIMRKRIFGLK